MLETINTVLSILGVGLSSYEMVSSVLQGDSSEELLAELQKQTQIQQQTNVQITRLSESILYAPQVEAVRDTSRTVQQIETDNQKVHDALSPIQQALGGDILSSAMIPTPEQMKQIMQADPFDILLEVRPMSFAQQPSNPNMVPILFEIDGIRYIGWQTLGALQVMFSVEYTTGPSGLIVAQTGTPQSNPPQIAVPSQEIAQPGTQTDFDYDDDYYEWRREMDL